MPDRRNFCATLGAAGLGALGPRRRPALTPAETWIPSPAAVAQIPQFMELAGVPGLGIAVVERGAVVWRRPFGVTNADTKAPVTDDTMFPAASLGKPVFAWVVLRLAEEGKLDLDRPLVDYYRPEGLGADERLDRITARHVLSHSTGLKNWRRRANPLLVTDFQPGARFQYSGEGFFWLQQVVEAVTGSAVDRVMRDRLFDPALMPRATYAWSPEVEALSVWGHDERGAVATQFSRDLLSKYLEVARTWGRPMHEWTTADTYRALAIADPTQARLPSFAIPNVAASLLVTATEYARFLGLVVGHGAGVPHLGDRMRGEMLTPRVVVNRGLSWGLGWGLERRDPDSLIWHWGDNGIFRAFALGDPRHSRAIVVFANSESGPKVYQRVIRAATGLDLDAFLWV